MSDKTIAEIIGFETCYPVDCDDMLAWLHAQNLQFDAMSFADRTGVSWGVSEWAEPPSVGEEVVDGHSPTLHAALEAAVRAVHDAEEAQ